MRSKKITVTSKLWLIPAALMLLATTSCADNTYNRIETGGTERTNSRLDESVSVLVMTPKDGGFAGKIYKGSGSRAARAIDAAFSRSARLVDVSPNAFTSMDDLQDVIAKDGYGYVVVPTIVTWARTEKGFSKTPAEVSVKIAVYSANAGEKVSSNYLEAKASSGFFSSSNEEPDELLLTMADDYSDDLYGVIFSFLK